MSICVVKYGGSSQTRIEDLKCHAKTIKDFQSENNLVVTVVSGAGNITNQIEDAINYRGINDCENIFAPWEVLYNELGKPKQLQQVRDGVYKKVEAVLKKVSVAKISDFLRAEINMYPEQLQAELVNYVYAEFGLNSVCVNFDDSSFPVSVRGHPLNGNLNLFETRKKCQELFSKNKSKIIVLPGYGGLDGVVRKTLGRGGSDTSAFALAYGFKADQVYIFTNVEGIKTAVIDGEKTETVKEISLAEARDAAFYGVKLPNPFSLSPLEMLSHEGNFPEVYIGHHKAEGEKTRIINTPSNQAVKVIGARKPLIFYRVQGDVLPLLRNLQENFVDLFATVINNSAIVGLNQKGREQGVEILEQFSKKGGLSIIETKSNLSLVGIIGEGMKNKKGVAAKMHARLSQEGINIESMLDASPFSTGVIISDTDQTTAVKSLYKEFFN